MEKIYIKNFGGTLISEIELNKINIFIGRQASGKSVTVKLIYFFKGIVRGFFEEAREDKTRIEVEKGLVQKFEEYFPSETWGEKQFEIIYSINDSSIRIFSLEKRKLKIELSKAVVKQFNTAKKLISSDRIKFKPKDTFEIYRPGFEVQAKYLDLVTRELGKEAAFQEMFIPAGRSFFANLQSSIFSFLSNNKAIDPFLVEFGSFYENIKSISARPNTLSENHIENIADETIVEILGGKYHRDKKKDYLIHHDQRRINVSYASSGQQETLPLLLILKSILRISFLGNGAAIFIEEPEAHLFPEAQRKIVEVLSLVYNNCRSELQLFITTHSPYILTSFNNLIQAGQISKQATPETVLKLNHIIQHEKHITPGTLSAYAMTNGYVNAIMDEETGLINSEYLDGVSEDIAVQFDELLDLY
jgi:AAA15 family ATPase/GTPase